MRTFAFALLALLALVAAPRAVDIALAADTAAACPAWQDQEFRKLHSRDSVNLCEAFAGKPLLVVNTASHCGFTPQFEGLEAVHRKYKDRGLAVVGFASDDFDQEANDEAEAAETCFVNFGVTFTMIAPQHVKGPQANPVFRELARQTTEPKWNFNKYLVSADGKTVRHFDSKVAPDSPEFAAAIESLLK